jgi:hypothetical protein
MLLCSAIKNVTGKDVPILEMIFSYRSNHPCFF